MLKSIFDNLLLVFLYLVCFVVSFIVFKLSEVYAARWLRTTAGKQAVLWCYLCCWQGTINFGVCRWEKSRL